MLAMVVNENAGCLIPRGACTSIASMLAPTGGSSISCRSSRRLRSFRRYYNGKCRLNNARNAAGFTGLAK
jgi:hypothetical protein